MSLQKLDYPDRLYIVSDVIGGARDITQRPDIDAIVSTHVLSGIDAVRQQFDIFHDERIAHHLPGLLLRLHQEGVDIYKDLGIDIGSSGLFINSAPRMKSSQNGAPFYLARFDGVEVRVVTTTLEALSSVRDYVSELLRFPNHSNGLYGNGEQFRSSFTPTLLASNSPFLKKLEEEDSQSIPELDLDPQIGYVDRFGNITVLDPESALWKQIEEVRGTIQLQVGDQIIETQIAQSLSDAEPGSNIVYPFNGGVDVFRKWEHGESPEERLNKSTYGQLGKPSLGESVKLELSQDEEASSNLSRSTVV